MLLPEESNPVDHLLCSRPRSVKSVGESRVLFLQKLNALG
jgi:hypothetical protein